MRKLSPVKSAIFAYDVFLEKVRHVRHIYTSRARKYIYVGMNNRFLLYNRI